MTMGDVVEVAVVVVMGDVMDVPPEVMLED